MEIVAITVVAGDPEQRAAELTAATGMSLYQARRHVASAGPRVVATYGSRQAAMPVVDRLRRAGFEPVVLTHPEPAGIRLLVRSFELEEGSLVASDRDGMRVRMPFDEIEVLLRGVRIGTDPDEREPFLAVHAGTSAVLVFREGYVQYEGLHLEREPTAAANFARLTEQLRRRAPLGAYDERLNTRAAQRAILGDVLTPEDHLDVALRLLAHTLRPLRSAA